MIPVWVMVMSCFVFAANLDSAVSWMYTNKLTIYSTTKDYNPTNYLRRDQAAKIFVKFAQVMGKTDSVAKESSCQFSDKNSAPWDLQPYLIQACTLGIFQGSSGKFYPQTAITNSQALAVLIRIIAGKQPETGVAHRYDNYYKKASELGILEWVNVTDKQRSISRGNMALLMYNATNHSTDTSTSETSSSDTTTTVSPIDDTTLEKEINKLLQF